MSPISFRITVDDDDAVRAIFDKLEILVVREEGDEEEEKVHYHGIVYDKGRETVRTIIKKQFETDKLKGNKLYSIKNVNAKGGTLEDAERYLSKGKGTELSELPNVILNSRGVDTTTRNGEYWRINRELSDKRTKRKVELRSFAKAFKEYFDNYVSDNNVPGSAIDIRFICKMLMDYGVERYKEDYSCFPMTCKALVQSIYQRYSADSYERRLEHFLVYCGYSPFTDLP